MKRPQQYFVCNKDQDYRRGWMENLRCDGGFIQVENREKLGIFWSRLLDSGQGDTVWQGLTMETSTETGVTMTIFAGEDDHLGDLLRNPHISDWEKQAQSQPYLVKTLFQPKDVLLHEAKGRYLWFRLELMPQGGDCPRVGNLQLSFPKDSWVSYLPEIYQESDFTGRFLAVYQSLYQDLTREIAQVARHFDSDVVGGEYLEWLSTWLGIEDGYLWPEDKLRRLMGEG
ncbi:MAG: hypothetical protein R3Y62_01080, partial [Eubacteriales bacterium]